MIITAPIKGAESSAHLEGGRAFRFRTLQVMSREPFHGFATPTYVDAAEGLEARGVPVPRDLAEQYARLMEENRTADVVGIYIARRAPPHHFRQGSDEYGLGPFLAEAIPLIDDLRAVFLRPYSIDTMLIVGDHNLSVYEKIIELEDKHRMRYAPQGEFGVRAAQDRHFSEVGLPGGFELVWHPPWQ